jgi:hypothetical protein
LLGCLHDRRPALAAQVRIQRDSAALAVAAHVLQRVSKRLAAAALPHLHVDVDGLQIVVVHEIVVRHPPEAAAHLEVVRPDGDVIEEDPGASARATGGQPIALASARSGFCSRRSRQAAGSVSRPSKISSGPSQTG